MTTLSQIWDSRYILTLFKGQVSDPQRSTGCPLTLLKVAHLTIAPIWLLFTKHLPPFLSCDIQHRHSNYS